MEADQSFSEAKTTLVRKVTARTTKSTRLKGLIRTSARRFRKVFCSPDSIRLRPYFVRRAEASTGERPFSVLPNSFSISALSGRLYFFSSALIRSAASFPPAEEFVFFIRTFLSHDARVCRVSELHGYHTLKAVKKQSAKRDCRMPSSLYPPFSL